MIATPSLLLAALLATPAHAAPAAAPRDTTLTVFAAASLRDAFAAVATEIEARHPGVTVQASLAGSQQLAAQLGQGAAADVFASADRRWMDDVAGRGLLAEPARAFAANRLLVIVPKANPARIDSLRHLARRGVKLVLASDAVPVGRYSRIVLGRLSSMPGFGADFARRVLGNVVSEEESVRGVVSKVQLGEADAGIAYVSDVTPAVSRQVRILGIPDAANVVATYPVAVLKEARYPALARELVAFLLSPEGQRLLERFGLMGITGVEAAAPEPEPVPQPAPTRPLEK